MSEPAAAGEPTPEPVGPARLDAAFFDAAFSCFDAAARKVGLVERDHSLGGVRVSVRVAGEALANALLHALAARAVPAAGDADLTLDVLDSASSGAFPAPPWAPGDYFLRDEVLNLPPGLRASYGLTTGVLSLLDGPARRGLFRVSGEAPAWDRGTPLRNLVHWGLEPHGLRLVHAAGVGRPAGGVLLAGPGGSGKSTAALACLVAGLGFLGDDHTLVTLEPQPRGFGLYSVAKVDARSARLLPGLPVETSPRPGEKAFVSLAEGFSDRLVDHFPVRAVVFPRVGARTGRPVGPIPAAEAICALGPSTIFQLPGAGQEAFRFLARLARAVPSFRLEVGEDVERIGPVIDELLAWLGATPS